MTHPGDGEVTALLEAIRAGDAGARDELFALLYPRLYQMAAGYLGQWPAADSLQATALLHEAVVGLLADELPRNAPNRAYLLGAASQLMRRILIEHARRRRTEKRGGGLRRLPMEVLLEQCEQERVDVHALNDALEALAQKFERAAQVVTLRTIGGYSAAEVSALLEVSLSTVEKDFRFARAWLHRALREGGDHAP
jgi:RNA polymerase sigma factor (TIGR02999 family)